MDETTIAQHRSKLTDEAARILGLPEEYIHRLSFPDGKILGNMNEHQLSVNDSLIALNNHNVQQLQLLLEELNPAVVFIPHHGEGWPDHVNVRGLMEEVRCRAELVEYCVWMWYYNVWRLDWSNARVLHLSADEHRRKTEAIDAYTTPVAPCGKPWSGVLPKVFLKAAKWNRELYFKVR
jgi:LmbE family N-acetylglucosaminyl deacetylase